MAISTLAVGIGGTGVLTLRYLKRAYQELAEDERVPCAFLAVDFDRSGILQGDADHRMAALSDEEFLYLDPQRIQDLLSNLDRGQDDMPAWEQVLRWFPDRGRVRIPKSELEGNGASQFRVLGRLGFFLNDEMIENRLRKRLTDIEAEVDPKRLSREKRIILISSVAGGTGAGMLLDVAYVARRLEGRPRIFAYLLLPEVFGDVDTGGRIFQNAYATLKELSYLKDQQIPFRGDYLKIPPVDVASGGEEPFVRLFLSGRNGGSGSDAIERACRRLGDTVLGQLHRTIQEKSLAVVSNTLSSQAAHEQRRLRTHCFSTAGSGFVDLTPVESIGDSLVYMIRKAVSDPTFLARIKHRQVHEMLDDARERSLSTAGETILEVPAPDTPPEPVPALGEAQESDRPVDSRLVARVDQLARIWRGRVNRAAIAGRDQCLRDLEQKLATVEADLGSGRPARVKEAAEQLLSLKNVILAEYGRDDYEDNLAALRRVADFDALDQNLCNEALSHLRAGAAHNDSGEAIKNQVFYRTLKDAEKHFSVNFPEAASEAMQGYQKAWKEIDDQEAEARKLSRWWRIGDRNIDRAYYGRQRRKLLEKALADPTLQKNLAAILRVRALKRLKQEIDKRLGEIEEQLAKARKPWQEMTIDDGKKISSTLTVLFERVIDTELPDLLDEFRSLAERVDDPDLLQTRLRDFVNRRFLASPILRNARYVIEGGENRRDWEDKILTTLVQCRQRLFERRTPNPQRKGFAIIMVPEGIHWPEGRERLERFLIANTEQLLDCRCQTVDYDGSRIWIYYEDLFNPPDHVHNLDEYYRRYAGQEFRELFHVDRRMLDFETFREIHSGMSTLTVTCGNDDCRENIAALPRGEWICPGCQRPIRSRCGNEGCTSNDLHRRPDRERGSTTCPLCARFNHAAWWQCFKHGKIPVDVPLDEERCPECIARHLDDPVAYVAGEIGVRPDLRDAVSCPRCEDLEAEDPAHHVFHVTPDLLPFFRNGVHGRDRQRFLQAARRHRLPDHHRCPRCRTSLIPYHHHRPEADLRSISP